MRDHMIRAEIKSWKLSPRHPNSQHYLMGQILKALTSVLLDNHCLNRRNRKNTLFTQILVLLLQQSCELLGTVFSLSSGNSKTDTNNSRLPIFEQGALNDFSFNLFVSQKSQLIASLKYHRSFVLPLFSQFPFIAQRNLDFSLLDMKNQFQKLSNSERVNTVRTLNYCCITSSQFSDLEVPIL